MSSLQGIISDLQILNLYRMVLIIVTVVLVALAFLALGISTFFSKKKKFPETHIGRNPAMRERGIHCATHEDE